MLITFLITMTLVSLCVTVHYELLYRLGGFFGRLPFGPRQEVVIGVIIALTAHVIEIYIFAAGFYYVLHTPSLGSFSGDAVVEDYFDCVYLSFVTYSTLGFGDMVPDGWVWFMVGTEAVTGLVHIAWTASFLYFQMEHHWGKSPAKPGRAGKRRR